MNLAGIHNTIAMIEAEVSHVKTLVITAVAESVRNMVSETVKAFGSTDNGEQQNFALPTFSCSDPLCIAANVASVMCHQRLPVAEYSLEEYDQVMNINT